MILVGKLGWKFWLNIYDWIKILFFFFWLLYIYLKKIWKVKKENYENIFIFYFLLSLLLLLLLNSNIISKIQLFFFNIEYLDNWVVSFRFIFMDRKRKLISFGFSFFWSKILYRNKYFILIRFYKKWREDMMHEKKRNIWFYLRKKKTSKFISNFSKFFHFNKHIWCYTPKKNTYSI